MNNFKGKKSQKIKREKGGVMKKLKENRLNKFLIGILVISVFSLTIGANELSAGDCEKAVQKCMAEAAMAGISGMIAGAAGGLWWIGALIWAGNTMFCIEGYFWCLRYYKQ